jgi:hypothetical protein
VGLDSLVGTSTLRAERSGGRLPVGGEIFRTRPDRPCGPRSSYTMGTGSLPGIKRPERGFDHLLPSSAEGKEMSTAIPLRGLF